MLKIKSQPFNSVWVSADSQKELSETFIRFQEYYESPNENFKGKIFTIGQVKNWYSITYGADTYSDDWVGFNFPSSVLIPFKQGLFDPLTSQEQELLNFFKYRNDLFYIIGAQNSAVLRHELAHALYSHNKKYAQRVDCLCKLHHKDLLKIKKYILDKGYHADVLNDELQAYITDNDDDFIIKNTTKLVINNFNKTYEKYSKEKVNGG